jgi:hypothetical protein
MIVPLRVTRLTPKAFIATARKIGVVPSWRARACAQHAASVNTTHGFRPVAAVPATQQAGIRLGKRTVNDFQCKSWVTICEALIREVGP